MILKLKRTPGIYLVGFMACGKSTVGRLLADRLGWRFADIDADIESNERVSISDIFDTRGEEAFRKLETEAIRARVREIQAGTPTVVALGGGAFTRTVNFELVETNGVTVWLDCPLPIVKERAARTTDRPLARDLKRFEELYFERRQSYLCADYYVEITSDDPDRAVRDILALPIF